MEAFISQFCVVLHDLFSSELFCILLGVIITWPVFHWFNQLLVKAFKAETKASDSRRSDSYFNTLSDSDN